MERNAKYFLLTAKSSKRVEQAGWKSEKLIVIGVVGDIMQCFITLKISQQAHPSHHHTNKIHF